MIFFKNKRFILKEEVSFFIHTLTLAFSGNSSYTSLMHVYDIKFCTTDLSNAVDKLQHLIF